MSLRIYTESQRMRDTVFTYVLGGVIILYFIGMILLFAAGAGNEQEMIISLSISAIILFLILWLFLSLKLEVRIEENRLSYRMPPLINKVKVIRQDEISSFEVLRYKPIRQYGGWGIRYSPKHGKAYTISGSQGLIIRLKTGKSILLGTRKMKEIEEAMNSMMHKSENYG